MSSNQQNIRQEIETMKSNYTDWDYQQISLLGPLEYTVLKSNAKKFLEIRKIPRVEHFIFY